MHPLWRHIRRPPWRTIYAGTLFMLALWLAWSLWDPGGDPPPGGAHDRGRNALWIGHGWLGDDRWFRLYHKDKSAFREPARLADLRAKLRRHGIGDVFPHLCPCENDGSIAASDPVQVERFLDSMEGVRVIPWIGGNAYTTAHLADPAWRQRFAESAGDLLRRHPRLAGVQVNIEPCRDGDADFLALLDAVRPALPEGKVLSVAAYPPPTVLHRAPDCHWGEPYVREVSKRADQIAFMCYDTAIFLPKLYVNLMADWTRDCLEWSPDSDVLIGLPAYDDDGVGYHHPDVENLPNALRGLHGALGGKPLPANYQGIAIYAGWEMDGAEWALLRDQFSKSGGAGSGGRAGD